MEPFNLDTWLKDKSRKVVTRNGMEAEIIHDSFPLVAIINGVAYNFDHDGKFQSNKTNHKYDLFFADEEKLNSIIDELKSYLEKTPKEQVEKDWKEIQDWYTQHFTNEKHNEEEELTEFEDGLFSLVSEFWQKHSLLNEEVDIAELVKENSKILLDLARKELLKDLPKLEKSN